jgi:hypothetical protein
MIRSENIYPLLFAVVLVASTLNIAATLPAQNEYYFGADEGVYYTQARTIKERGISGYREIVNNYLHDPGKQIFPSPLRLGHLIPASFALWLNDSISSLSYLSLTAYVVLCIVSFLFAAHFWNPMAAFVIGTALCCSPVARGLARRALMDSEYWLISAATLFAFIYFIESPTNRRFVLFLGLATIGLLVKETTAFFFPFFVLVLLWLRFKSREPITIRHILGMFAPPLAVLIIYVVVLGGWSWVSPVVGSLFTHNITTPTTYHQSYLSGPWYSYLVDYFVLSPLFSILFFLFCGFYLARPEKSRAVTVLLLFFAYHLVFLAFLPKNVRYAVGLDTVYRLCASLMVLTLIEKHVGYPARRTMLLAGSLALLVFLDVKTYYKMFITNRVYDLVSSNFLTVERFVPAMPALQAAGSEATAEGHLQLSVRYFQEGQFEKSIEEAEAALRLAPDFPEAYNNLGAAYGALGLWEEEIIACEKALQLRPDFQLAKNNLEWASFAAAVQPRRLCYLNPKRNAGSVTCVLRITPVEPAVAAPPLLPPLPPLPPLAPPPSPLPELAPVDWVPPEVLQLVPLEHETLAALGPRKRTSPPPPPPEFPPLDTPAVEALPPLTLMLPLFEIKPFEARMITPPPPPPLLKPNNVLVALSPGAAMVPVTAVMIPSSARMVSVPPPNTPIG